MQLQSEYLDLISGVSSLERWAETVIGQASQPIVLAIAGGSASGKGYTIGMLEERLGDRVVTLSQDRYFQGGRPHPSGYTNHDHPADLELRAYAADLLQLRDGQTVMAPEYCFKRGERKKRRRPVRPAPLIIADGLFWYAHASGDQLDLERLSYADLRVFIQADDELRKKRRMVRDELRAGRPQEETAKKWDYTVRPMFEQFVEPQIRLADVVIHNNKDL